MTKSYIESYWFIEPDKVAPLTRLAGSFTVKKPAMEFPRLTWTALDVGGPCVEAFGRIQEMAHLSCCKAANSKKLLRYHSENRWREPCYWLAFTPHLARWSMLHKVCPALQSWFWDKAEIPHFKTGIHQRQRWRYVDAKLLGFSDGLVTDSFKVHKSFQSRRCRPDARRVAVRCGHRLACFRRRSYHS